MFTALAVRALSQFTPRVNWVEGLPQDEQRPELSGAQEFHVTKGDMLHVPARSWHQVKVADGDSISYALINVFEDD